MLDPMVEFVADRDLLMGAKTNWDIVPEVQVTLSRRQHIRAAFGIQTPSTTPMEDPSRRCFICFGIGSMVP